MNIVFVLSDTLRWDHLACYGKPPWGWDIHAPAINRLASESVVFDRFYEGSAPTILTIHDLLTGRHCFHCGGPVPGFLKHPMLQSVLKKAGCITQLITDAHNYPDPGHGIHKDFDGFEFIRGQQGDKYRTAPRDPVPPCSSSQLFQREL